MLEVVKSCFDDHAELADDPAYISREGFLPSEIAKLGYHAQTRVQNPHADPDDFITDVLCEGGLTPKIRKQLLWVVVAYEDGIDWNFQVRFANNHGCMPVLADLMNEAATIGREV